MAGPASVQVDVQVPRLESGDRLTRDEFERRYRAMPELKRAELIEGVVYVSSPVRHSAHSGPHGRLVTWLGVYAAATPGVDLGIDGTLRLDLDNEVQPDAFLRLARGGSSQLGSDDYLEGAPELIAEVAASTASYDLHDKLHVYRRNGVREYLVWRTQERALDWFVLTGGRYERLAPQEGLLRSPSLGGLWLDVAALLVGDQARVLRALEAGLTSPDHAAFVAGLR